MAYKDPLDPRDRAGKRKYYRAHKQEFYDRNVKAAAARVAWMREQKAVPCMDCGVSYPYYVMDFDHRDRSEKLGNVGRMVRVSWAKLKAEVAKCDVVCSNCHRERTHASSLEP